MSNLRRHYLNRSERTLYLADGSALHPGAMLYGTTLPSAEVQRALEALAREGLVQIQDIPYVENLAYNPFKVMDETLVRDQWEGSGWTERFQYLGPKESIPTSVLSLLLRNPRETQTFWELLQEYGSRLYAYTWFQQTGQRMAFSVPFVWIERSVSDAYVFSATVPYESTLPSRRRAYQGTGLYREERSLRLSLFRSFFEGVGFDRRPERLRAIVAEWFDKEIAAWSIDLPSPYVPLRDLLLHPLAPNAILIPENAHGVPVLSVEWLDR